MREVLDIFFNFLFLDIDSFACLPDHYASTLFCKDQCETWLATIHGKVVENYLPNHFHFLQYAYFQGESYN